MNNNTSEPVSPVLNEADVLLWLRNRVASLRVDARLELRVGGDEHRTFVIYTHGFNYAEGSGATFDEAKEAFFAQHPTPEQLAQEKREQARKLLEEANKLSNQE